MATFLLVIIYMAFISLGLPDSLLGVSWPLIRVEFGSPVEAAGLVSLAITGSTIVSSLISGYIIKRFKTGKVTLVSTLLTAVALLGFSFAPALGWFLLLAIPLGLGAGSVDAALNGYVATHYQAHHMSWLHSFWGVGATMGPIVMARAMGSSQNWRNGYWLVAIIQLSLAAVMFATLPLWRKVDQMRQARHEAAQTPVALTENQPAGPTIADSPDEPEDLVPIFPIPESPVPVKPLKIPGVKLALAAFLFYCGAEMSMGLWGSSYLVATRQLTVEKAGELVSLYYAGITVGRFLTGFLTFRFSSRLLIRAGQLIALVGVILLALPLPAVSALVGFILIGLGCAPIFPGMIHETPARFGTEHAQLIIGYQMAAAYVGLTILPPLLGWVAARTTIAIMPFFLVLFVAVMLASTEKINRLTIKTTN